MMANRIPTTVDTPTMTAGDREKAEFWLAALEVEDPVERVGAVDTVGFVEITSAAAGTEVGLVNVTAMGSTDGH